MFDADRPITKIEQDKLNRSVFAKYLARCLLDQKDPDSLVVGLYGGWGTGKTSIINMVAQELNFAATNLEDPEKPIILNFSPWSYSGQNQLIYNFFRRLSSTIRNVTYLENADRIIYLLELYVSFFTQKPIPHSLQTKPSLLIKLIGGKQADQFGWESGRDLTLVKAELNELLRQQKHKIIVIIDNISRLQDNEIKQIFQIVKSMGDYANTAYLLAMDKDQVERALDKTEYGEGKNWLEKIVQLPFDVPPISQQDLELILADRLGETIVTTPERTWNVEYWSDLYFCALKYCFNNCRDITRYVNTLNFSYPRLRDIVNPVDFFALTAIEVFLPDVYVGIRENKDLFSDLLDNVYQLDERQLQEDKLRCDEILARSDHLSREMTLDLLIRLFPRLRLIYQPNVPFYHSNNLSRKLKRLCSPDLFDAYFRLSMQSGQISDLEFQTILAIAYDAELFDQSLTRFNQDNRIPQFLDKLDSSMLRTIPEANITAIISALFDNGDLFPVGITGPLHLDTPMRIHRIINQLLQRLPKSEARFNALQTAISRSTKSIHIIVHELREESREHLENEDTFLPLEFRLLTPQQLTALRQLAVSKIEYWAQDNRLLTHPKLLPLLVAWRDWGNLEICQQYIEKETATDKGLVTFLVAILNKPISEITTIYERSLAWENYLNDISTFIAPSKLVTHARAIFEDGYFEKLQDNEQLAVMIFLDLMHADTVKVIPNTSS